LRISGRLVEAAEVQARASEIHAQAIDMQAQAAEILTRVCSCVRVCVHVSPRDMRGGGGGVETAGPCGTLGPKVMCAWE
jgi:hypothetical protein